MAQEGGLIALGLDRADRAALVATQAAGYRRVFSFSPARHALPGQERITDMVRAGQGSVSEYIEWSDIIMYRFYYPLLERTDRDTLVVVNEPLRTQNRHDLGYNCLRHILNRAGGMLVLSTLPIIDGVEDLMILVDFATRDRWARQPFSPEMHRHLRVEGKSLLPGFVERPVVVSAATRARYAAEKTRLVTEARANPDGDPHCIPRQLALIGGKSKMAAVSGPALARNKRLGTETFDDVASEGSRVLVELPHRFIDYCEALAITRAPITELLVTDLPVDRWYADRYAAWAGRVADVATALHG